MDDEKLIENKLRKIVAQVKSADINLALKDLDLLHGLLHALTGLLDRCQIRLPSERYEFYEAMLIKFRLNVRSIMELYAPGAPPDDEVIYHDLGSIYLLSRSLLENYLVFFYCFGLPATEEEGQMNYLIFVISGLVTHLSSGINDSPKDPEHLQWRTKREQQLQSSRDALGQLACFQALPAKTQKDFLAGNYAKRYGFQKLIELSPLQDILFTDIWRLYSNYAHSEMVGLLQINSYATDRKGHENALFSTLGHALMLTSAIIKDHLRIYENTPAEHIDLPEINDENFAAIEYWYGMATTAGVAQKMK
jgi:hypothetical protein